MSPDNRTSQSKAVSAVKASGRLFRTYRRHCTVPGPDTLFETLTAMHSLNDRLQKTESDFHQIEESVALKALRNFAHHKEEILSIVRVVAAPAISDLAFVCIVRRDQVERAILNVDKRWRANTQAACETKFHWYGDAVNINPCLFNFMVRAYEMLMRMGLDVPDDSVVEFGASYRSEEEEGHSHHVDGRLTSRPADLAAVFSAIVADLPNPYPPDA